MEIMITIIFVILITIISIIIIIITIVIIVIMILLSFIKIDKTYADSIQQKFFLGLMWTIQILICPILKNNNKTVGDANLYPL